MTDMIDLGLTWPSYDWHDRSRTAMIDLGLTWPSYDWHDRAMTDMIDLGLTWPSYDCHDRSRTAMIDLGLTWPSYDGTLINTASCKCSAPSPRHGWINDNINNRRPVTLRPSGCGGRQQRPAIQSCPVLCVCTQGGQGPAINKHLIAVWNSKRRREKKVRAEKQSRVGNWVSHSKTAFPSSPLFTTLTSNVLAVWQGALRSLLLLRKPSRSIRVVMVRLRKWLRRMRQRCELTSTALCGTALWVDVHPIVWASFVSKRVPHCVGQLCELTSAPLCGTALWVVCPIEWASVVSCLPHCVSQRCELSAPLCEPALWVVCPIVWASVVSCLPHWVSQLCELSSPLYEPALRADVYPVCVRHCVWVMEKDRVEESYIWQLSSVKRQTY